ncbi:hypothetical protein [Sphingobacterium thermophilum]|uniref:Uncharacterized protein n=1 Tax=Sphingobacterium thermophilum TaxID=768534 RepID=A0ABP8R8K3_9SPHI
MQKKDFILGMVIGVIAPLASYLLTQYTSLQQDYFVEKPIAIHVLAAAINLIVVRFAYRAGKESLAKGVMLLTFLAMVVLIWLTKLKV